MTSLGLRYLPIWRGAITTLSRNRAIPHSLGAPGYFGQACIWSSGPHSSHDSRICICIVPPFAAYPHRPVSPSLRASRRLLVQTTANFPTLAQPRVSYLSLSEVFLNVLSKSSRPVLIADCLCLSAPTTLKLHGIRGTRRRKPTSASRSSSSLGVLAADWTFSPRIVSYLQTDWTNFSWLPPLRILVLLLPP
jgi:hypothetical protein